MTEIRSTKIHRVHADERVMVIHHPDGSRTVCDQNGVPDRYVPARLTWAQWKPERDRVRLRGLRRGIAIGKRVGFRVGTIVGSIVATLIALALSALSR